jgi:gamma-glutamyl:cysteine ligase YbdK (ATP-grasp superfamily)
MLAAHPLSDYDMPVQPESLEILEKAEVPPAQARAIVQAIEIEIAGAKETVATRQDVLILRHEMAEMRTELRHEIQELGTRLELRISGVESSLESRLDSRFSGLEPRFQSLESRIARVETRMDSLVTQRQLYGALLGQMAVLPGIAYFFVVHVSH